MKKIVCIVSFLFFLSCTTDIEQILGRWNGTEVNANDYIYFYSDGNAKYYQGPIGAVLWGGRTLYMHYSFDNNTISFSVIKDEASLTFHSFDFQSTYTISKDTLYIDKFSTDGINYSSKNFVKNK